MCCLVWKKRENDNFLRNFRWSTSLDILSAVPNSMLFSSATSNMVLVIVQPSINFRTYIRRGKWVVKNLCSTSWGSSKGEVCFFKIDSVLSSNNRAWYFENLGKVNVLTGSFEETLVNGRNMYRIFPIEQENGSTDSWVQDLKYSAADWKTQHSSGTHEPSGLVLFTESRCN